MLGFSSASYGLKANGKIYHNIYLSELLDPKEAKKLASSKAIPVSQPDEDMPF